MGTPGAIILEGPEAAINAALPNALHALGWERNGEGIDETIERAVIGSEERETASWRMFHPGEMLEVDPDPHWNGEPLVAPMDTLLLHEELSRRYELCSGEVFGT